MQMPSKKIFSIIVLSLTLVSLLGCSTPTDVDTSQATESTINETTESETTAPIIVEETTTSTSAMATLPPASTTVTAAPVVLMPNVVCMNLQAAQDEIQKYGVFFSRSSDATGMSRSQLIDRNWVVIKQTPLPGQPVTELEAVLSVVKIGESTGGVC